MAVENKNKLTLGEYLKMQYVLCKKESIFMSLQAFILTVNIPPATMYSTFPSYSEINENHRGTF